MRLQFRRFGLRLIPFAVAFPLGAMAAVWQVGPVNGAPGILKDGKAVSPLIFWQREGEEADVRAMSAAGMELFSFFPMLAHDENPYWRVDGNLDLGWQTERIDRALKWSPNAAILPRIYYTLPLWWCRMHPEECVAFENSAATAAVGPRASYASRLARKEGTQWYRKVISELERRYGDRLFGYHLVTGPWGEHFAWDAWVQGEGPGFGPLPGGDRSEPMRKAFAEYVRAKYRTVERLRSAWRDPEVDFDKVTIPTIAERTKLNADGWRDPSEGRCVPDFFECLNAVVPEMLGEYAEAVKTATDGRKLTVAFYGYTQDEPWAIECDHRGTSAALRLKDMDCFSAPHTYRRRAMGEDGLPRHYLASTALHGKFFIDEGDDFTYLEMQKPKPDGRASAKTLDESLAFIYREFGNAVTYGIGLWYMDLAGGNFRDPKIVETVGRLKTWGEKAMNYPRAHLSEVAVISNPESEFYLEYRNRRPKANPPDLREPSVGYRLYNEQIRSFCRAGAPWDWYLADDLESVAARKDVKVVALLDCEYLTDEQVAVIERMRKDGKRLVFFHAPGYVSQSGLYPDRFPETSKFLEARLLSSVELREIYRAAGVHVYTDEDIVLSANASWVMVHAASPRTCHLKLPCKAKRVYDIVTEKELAVDADEFDVPLGAVSTAVLLIVR